MVQGTKINEITVGGVTVSVWTATDPPNSIMTTSRWKSESQENLEKIMTGFALVGVV